MATLQQDDIGAQRRHNYVEKKFSYRVEEAWLCVDLEGCGYVKVLKKNMVIRGLGVTWLSKGFGGRII